MNSHDVLVNPAHHHNLLRRLFLHRGYLDEEAYAVAEVATSAARHGVHTHSGPKALELESRFHCANGPRHAIATLEHPPKDPAAVRCTTNVGHYLWGGYYALRAARQGRACFTTCTTPAREVAPTRGKHPAMGTNPWTWALPTRGFLGFDILVDIATSKISMSRAHDLRAAGLPLPSFSALDAKGRQTTEPHNLHALLPFAGHKGFGLGLLTELLCAAVGGHPPSGRDSSHLVTHFWLFFLLDWCVPSMRQTIEDILHSNPQTILPGQREHEAAEACADAGALLIPPRHFEILNLEADKADLSPLATL